MADKLTKDEVQALIMGHLSQYAQKVAEVVDDYGKMQRERDMPQEGKLLFSDACMKDVATLTNILTKFVHEAMVEGGLPTTPPPQAEIHSEADIIDLEQYRANGGLLN